MGRDHHDVLVDTDPPSTSRSCLTHFVPVCISFSHSRSRFVCLFRPQLLRLKCNWWFRWLVFRWVVGTVTGITALAVLGIEISLMKFLCLDQSTIWDIDHQFLLALFQPEFVFWVIRGQVWVLCDLRLLLRRVLLVCLFARDSFDIRFIV